MEIGARLKEAREANNISLDSLQETTKIQKRYLLAIEQGNLHLLPGKFYARAFIKEYAAAVGLNADELLDSYQDEPSQAEEQSDTQFTRVQRSRQESRTSKSPAILSIIPKIIVFLLVVGIIFAAVYFYQQSMLKENPDQLEQPDSDEIIRNKDNQQEPPKDNTPIDTDQDEQEPEPDEIKSELKLIEVGTGNRPESTFEINSVDGKVQLIFEPTGVSWLDVKNELGESLLGVMTVENTPIELVVTDEKRIRVNIGDTAQLPVILINDIEFEYPADSTTQSFWININNTTE